MMEGLLGAVEKDKVRVGMPKDVQKLLNGRGFRFLGLNGELTEIRWVLIFFPIENAAAGYEL